LRDRLTVARDLLTDSGSIFVQIGDENVHRVRAMMDEVFGEQNYQNTIYFQTTGGLATSGLSRIGDYVLWYSKKGAVKKYRRLFLTRS
jgi:adenine-specific DNA-methyltransferase